MRAWVWLLGSLLFADATAATVELTSGSDDYSLSRGLMVAVDPGDRLSLADLMGGRAGLRSVERDSMTFGFDPATYWFKGEIANRDHPESRWVLLIEYTLLDQVDLYLIDAAGNPSRRASGDLQPFSSRDLDHRFFNFVLELPPGAAATTFYLRVKSKSSLQVPLRLMTPGALAQSNYRAQIGFGILYGIFLALISYNLILFVSIRDWSFLYYVLYVAAFVLIQMTLNGFAFQYLWPDRPQWANTAVVFLLPVGMLAMFQFCRSFLNLPTQAPRDNRIFLVLMAVCALLAALSFVVDYRALILTESALVFIAAAMIVVSGVRSWLAGYRPARYFLLAWALLIAGMIAYTSVSFGLLPKVFLTEFGIQIGAAAEMILLSFALADRLSLVQERARALTEQTQTTLEFRVEERTRELNEALKRLELANKILRQSSQRDGLTGVYNRRYLDEALKSSWAKAIETGQPLALIVLDLDHFKEVNDRRGHLAGDDCLRAVATALTDVLESFDCVLARFGGEEFFVVLPGLSAEQAGELAERLRETVAALEVVSEDQTFRVTASFGAAAISPGGGRTDRDLIRNVDQAMYEAKKQGRNRVVVASLSSSAA